MSKKHIWPSDSSWSYAKTIQMNNRQIFAINKQKCAILALHLNYPCSCLFSSDSPWQGFRCPSIHFLCQHGLPWMGRTARLNDSWNFDELEWASGPKTKRECCLSNSATKEMPGHPWDIDETCYLKLVFMPPWKQGMIGNQWFMPKFK